MNRPEESLHRSIAHFLRIAAPGLLWMHIPNGGGRSKAEGGILKALGVRAGAPDLLFVLPGGRAAFIELKAVGGRQSADQCVFEIHALNAGALYLVCSSLAEVEGALRAWGVRLRAREAA